jgi:alkylation response protein AidB-like acyl-CoA dehydrogenase
MSDPWSETQREAVEAARRFAEAALAPRPAPRGFDREAWGACAREGYPGLALPPEWGGRGQGAMTTVGVFEALGRGGADRGLLFALSAHLFGCSVAAARFANGPGQAEWGRRLAQGTAVGALAVTEESAGSSLSGLATLARPDGSGYRIRGTKTLITNGPAADLFLLLAAENPGRGLMGLTAFLLPRETAGLGIETLDSTLGLAGAPMARLALDDCFLPRESVVGRPGGGFAVLKVAFQWERTCLSAGFLGAAERDLERCLGYVRRRRDAAGPLFERQAVAHRLARLRCRLEAARQLLYRGARAIDLGEDPLLWPAMVKLFVCESLVEAAREVFQTLAGAGWLDEGGAARAVRDVLALTSASGTSDIMLNTIAARLR